VSSSRLAFVALSVADVDRAERFYREAFDVELEQGEPPVRHVEARWRDGGPLHFALFPAAAGAPTSAQVGFVVDDLDRAHARAVRAGAAVVQEPRVEPWGRAATYLDPDGNVVSLTERARPVRAAGVDVAGGAWAVVVLEGSRVVDAFRCESFADALLVDAEAIGVDIPIGLPDGAVRPADAAARRFIGSRASSVFSTPSRAVLEQPSYADARRVAIELTGKSVSAQAYALGRRILEVDDYARTDPRVIEVHPEASFRELARRPLRSKHTSDGLAERRRLLEEDARIEVPATAPRIAEPDLLDATIAAWSAARYARGQALALPEGHAERIGAIWR
jgi:predicted RNase H-like nuclease/predicted enzyme related to lactoylglutathione lyase